MADPDRLNVEAVERALKWTGVELERLCETWGRPSGRWWAEPLLCDFLTHHAVRVLMKRHRARGAKWRDALIRACAELGLNAKAIESRVRRHDRAYLRTNERPLADDFGNLRQIGGNGA